MNNLFTFVDNKMISLYIKNNLMFVLVYFSWLSPFLMELTTGWSLLWLIVPFLDRPK